MINGIYIGGCMQNYNIDVITLHYVKLFSGAGKRISGLSVHFNVVEIRSRGFSSGLWFFRTTGTQIIEVRRYIQC